MLKGRPGSADFMEHYAELLAQSENAAAQVGQSLNKPGTIDAVILRYVKHDVFTEGLATATQKMRRPILDAFRDFRTPSGRRYGDNQFRTMIRQDIDAVLKGKTPNAQKNWMKTIRPMIAFAIAEGECKTDPTIGIRTTRAAKSDGHLTWDDEQIEQYRERHANGTMARLALELMLNIAARRHDAA